MRTGLAQPAGTKWQAGHERLNVDRQHALLHQSRGQWLSARVTWRSSSVLAQRDGVERVRESASLLVNAELTVQGIPQHSATGRNHAHSCVVAATLNPKNSQWPIRRQTPAPQSEGPSSARSRGERSRDAPAKSAHLAVESRASHVILLLH